MKTALTLSIVTDRPEQTLKAASDQDLHGLSVSQQFLDAETGSKIDCLFCFIFVCCFFCCCCFVCFFLLFFFCCCCFVIVVVVFVVVVVVVLLLLLFFVCFSVSKLGQVWLEFNVSQYLELIRQSMIRRKIHEKTKIETNKDTYQ